MADIETDIRSELLGPELRRGVFGAELFLRSEELDLNCWNNFYQALNIQGEYTRGQGETGPRKDYRRN